MFALVLIAAAPGQFVVNDDFSMAAQKAAYDATVEVFHLFSRGEGSAVIIHRDGARIHLLTAAHNVSVEKPENPQTEKDSVQLTVYSSNPGVSSRKVSATVVARMPNEDLAILMADLPDGPTPLRICPKNKLPPRERFPFPAMTVGCFKDEPPKIQFDKVTDVKAIRKPDRAKANFWEATVPQEVGRSGGPLLDKRGFVMGICSGTRDKKGYYAHIGEIHDALKNQGYSWLYAGTLGTEK